MSASTSNISPTDESRAGIDQYRILVLGRTGAGKTTILQRMSNTTEDPEVFDSNGTKIDTSVISPAAMEGIDYQLVFKSNPGFIFHDSLGFEAGDGNGLEIVRRFILLRGKQTEISEQLHAIWYCIPLNDSRPITAAEERFFQLDTGNVPVILIFTKLDALDLRLWDMQEPFERAKQKALSTAKGYWKRICQMPYPPRDVVYFRDLHKPQSITQINELVRATKQVILTNTNLPKTTILPETVLETSVIYEYDSPVSFIEYHHQREFEVPVVQSSPIQAVSESTLSSSSKVLKINAPTLSSSSRRLEASAYEVSVPAAEPDISKVVHAGVAKISDLNRFRFRILLIGKSGVGKSSLLNALFGSTVAEVAHYRRGRADINKEFIMSGNECWVFHDSLGFEPGEVDTFHHVQEFIRDRAHRNNIEDRLHAIWLCLQVPTAGGRLIEPVTETLLRMKSSGEMGGIPLIIVLTKYDLLITEAWSEIMTESGVNRNDPPPYVKDQEVELMANRRLEETRFEIMMESRVNLNDPPPYMQGQDVEMMANRRLEETCLKPLNDIAVDVSYAVISIKEKYRQSIETLVEKTKTLASEYIKSVTEPSPKSVATARQASPSMKIDDAPNSKVTGKKPESDVILHVDQAQKVGVDDSIPEVAPSPLVHSILLSPLDVDGSEVDVDSIPEIAPSPLVHSILLNPLSEEDNEVNVDSIPEKAPSPLVHSILLSPLDESSDVDDTPLHNPNLEAQSQDSHTLSTESENED